jgi:hypothetical protein
MANSGGLKAYVDFFSQAPYPQQGLVVGGNYNYRQYLNGWGMFAFAL